MNRRSFRRHGRGPSAGFSLIEVMIAILVLGVGLLGFALLQTMSVRFTQSANQRTQATNLATDMLDQMRVNRLAAGQYAGNYAATTTAASCVPDGTVTPAKYKVIWRCRMGMALGAGATAVVTYNNGQANVAITWGDQRWDTDASKRNATFSTGTRL